MSPRILIFAALFLAGTAPAVAQTPQRAPYVNGPVSSLLVDGDTLYVGGTFTAAGTAAGPLSFVAAGDGRMIRSQPGFSGHGKMYWWKIEPSLEVDFLLADGAGGWYAGGVFTRVDGHARTSLVHLMADGTVDPDFSVDLVGSVEALARHGSTLWVGGHLTELHGQATADLIALDAQTGGVLAVDPPGWGPIRDLEVSGNRLYVVGSGGLLSLDARTGVRDGWPTLNTEVRDVEVRDGIVYIAGLERVYGNETTGAAALRESDASLVTQFPITSADAVAVGDGVVVFRGSFRSKYGRTLGAFDPVSGADRGWFTDVVGYGSGGQIAISGSRLYAAELEGFPSRFGAFDLRDGSAVPWSPPLLGGWVNTLAAADGVIAIGGRQAALDGVPRSNLAAFDLRTGAVKPFAPEPRTNDGYFDPIVAPDVSTLLKVGGVLYAGGSFHTVGGAAQRNVAALDPVTGALLPFPDATAPVSGLAESGGTLYVGGARGRLGAVQTDGLGAVALATGAAQAWAPALGCDVDALAVAGTTLHAGGCFGLRSYRELTEVPGPAVEGRVWTLRGDGGGGVWAGGAFAGGNVAHFGPDGTELVDSPVTDGPVYDLAIAEETVHLGGSFTRIQDAPRHNVGQVRLVGGSVTAFNPRPTSVVTAVAPLAGGELAIGGGFDSTWDATSGGLAVFGDPPAAKVRAPERPARVKPRLSGLRASPSRAALPPRHG